MGSGSHRTCALTCSLGTVASRPGGSNRVREKGQSVGTRPEARRPEHKAGVVWRTGELAEDDEGQGRHRLESELTISSCRIAGGPEPSSRWCTHRKTPLQRLAHGSLLAPVSDPTGDERADTEEELEGSGQSASVGRVRCVQ